MVVSGACKLRRESLSYTIIRRTNTLSFSSLSLGERHGMQLLALCVGALAAGSVQGFAAVDDSNDLKILHWVHVPKAGGTAITALLKKVVCQINPSIRKTNPCCREQLCLHSNACHAAVGGCPLVTAVGRHSSNMALATSIPCCSSDLTMGITSSFVYFALARSDTLLKDTSGRASLPIWPLVDRVAFLLSTGRLVC